MTLFIMTFIRSERHVARTLTAFFVLTLNIFLEFYFISVSEGTEETNLVTYHEQDVMVRAFEHVVRKNRPNGYEAAVVIGNAMDILSDIELFKEESYRDFFKTVGRFPHKVTDWLKRTFTRFYIK